MDKCKDTFMIITDCIFVFLVGVGVYLSVYYSFFYDEYPISYVGAFGQFTCFYIWIRLRMASEYIQQQTMYKINFYGLMYSVINTVYATIILFFSYKNKNAMYQKQLYFFAYIVWWGLGLTQIMIYALWHQVFTGVNYTHFHHRRELTPNELQFQNDLDDYLMNLSDSSDSKGEDSGENRINFEDPTHFKVYNHIKIDKISDEYWSICLEKIEKGQKVVETYWFHVFHKRCLKSHWDSGKQDWPNWRKNIISMSENFERINSSDSSSNSTINDTIQSAV